MGQKFSEEHFQKGHQRFGLSFYQRGMNVLSGISEFYSSRLMKKTPRVAMQKLHAVTTRYDRMPLQY